MPIKEILALASAIVEVSEQPAPTGAEAQSPDGPKNCPNCGSENFKPIAAILETSVIRKILVHLKLPDKPPDIAPARLPRQMSFV